MGILPILLALGGIYYLTRKRGASGELEVTPPPATSAVEERFKKDLEDFKKSSPTFKDADAAIDSFYGANGADERARALAMIEFQATALDKKINEDARAAAQRLAFDFRDLFASKGRGKEADNLLVAVKSFISKAEANPELWNNRAAIADVDKASVALIVNLPFLGQATKVVTDRGDYPTDLVDGKTSAPAGKATVNIDGDYKLRSMTTKDAAGAEISTFIARVVDSDVAAAKGGYLVVFAAEKA